MRPEIKQKIITVCNRQIEQKGANVGLSFYAFFANKNDDPQLLMEVAQWWILTNRLDHFEKAVKIKQLVEEM
jgi:Family of unknown function (DUF6500)